MNKGGREGGKEKGKGVAMSQKSDGMDVEGSQWIGWG